MINFPELKSWFDGDKVLRKISLLPFVEIKNYFVLAFLLFLLAFFPGILEQESQAKVFFARLPLIYPGHTVLDLLKKSLRKHLF